MKPKIADRALFVASMLALLLCNTVHAQQSGVALVPAGCANLGGSYIVSGSGPAYGDVLTILSARHAGTTGSLIKLEWVPAGLGVWSRNVDPLDPDDLSLPDTPNAILQRGQTFTCKGGAYVFKPLWSSSRQGANGWLSGKAIIQLSRAGARGLSISSTFKGRQQISLYSYDSANLSIPKLGTQETLIDLLVWDNYADATAAARDNRKQDRQAAAAEPAEVAQVRAMFNRTIMGPLNLGWVEKNKDGVGVSMTARKSEDIPAFEERLRAADIRYEIKTEPIWTNNAWYMNILIKK